MEDFRDFDFTATIRDFDFTRKAVNHMNRITDSKDFESMDAEMIFNYLANSMEVVGFHDYLKRYIFKCAQIGGSFSAVPDEVYLDIMTQSFKERHAPYSFQPTTRKMSATLKAWLSQMSVQRNVIFLLGFGLGMTDSEVSEFLTKVIKEADFNFQSSEECIYWFCYYKGLPYSKAAELLKAAESLKETMNEQLWTSMSVSPKIYLGDEKRLLQYLSLLKGKGIENERSKTAFAEFRSLYDHVCEIIAADYTEDSEETGKKQIIHAEDITPADVEKTICSGIPVNSSGNLQKMSASLLEKQFQQKRMSRQRISNILDGKQKVERFDLITMMFYIYAREVEPDWPAERYIRYVDEINEMLVRSGMMEIYPANPYEAFVLMCLLTEYPLDSYAEVWERSYQNS